MEILHHLSQVAEQHRRAVVALGNFDGVHRGHQSIIADTTAAARAMGTKSMVLTFEPHPLQVIRGAAGPKLITSPEKKARLMEALGLDILFNLPFTPLLARVEPEEFINRILYRELRPRAVFVGFNFTFGHHGAGNPSLLAGKGRELGFAVNVVPPVLHAGTAVSSSAIRETLQAGDIDRAFQLLGYWPVIEGRVVTGDGRGRQIGFPTANVQAAPEMLIPAEGVYAGRFLADGLCGTGVVNIGRRPTFGPGLPPSVEVYVLDFAGDLYGKKVALELRARLRPERKFDGVKELLAQIEMDVADALRISADW